LNNDTRETVKRYPWTTGVRQLGHHENGLLAVFKPGGVLSHPNEGQGKERALLPWKYDHKRQCYLSPDPYFPDLHLLHRIDSPTSGVVLLSSTEGEADRVRSLFANRSVEKTYYAIVKGRLQSPLEVWTDHLNTKREKGFARTVTQKGIESVTEVRSPSRPPRHATASLLEFKPRTGRTHQIRVQCANRQMPILGDLTYGDFAWNKEWRKNSRDKDLYLHAARLRLPMGKEGLLTVCAEFPESYARALPLLGLPTLPFVLKDRFNIS
jgi:tRNA pseudouridine65 synthase